MEFIEKQASTRTVGLKPLTVNDHLRDGALANVADKIVGRCGVVVDVDFGIGKIVHVEKLFGGSAVATPGGGVDGNLHFLSVACVRW